MGQALCLCRNTRLASVSQGQREEPLALDVASSDKALKQVSTTTVAHVFSYCPDVQFVNAIFPHTHRNSRKQNVGREDRREDRRAMKFLLFHYIQTIIEKLYLLQNVFISATFVRNIRFRFSWWRV
jgi:hypothetical protein